MSCRKFPWHLIVVVVVGWLEGCSLDVRASRSRHLSGARATIGVGFEFEFHGFSVGEGAETFDLDGALVDKDVLVSVVGGDESKSLGGIEPLDGTFLGLEEGHRLRMTHSGCRLADPGLSSNGEEGDQQKEGLVHGDVGEKSQKKCVDERVEWSVADLVESGSQPCPRHFRKH